jgi:hypothetical protein
MLLWHAFPIVVTDKMNIQLKKLTMKKALLFISIFTLILAACTTKPKIESAAQMPAYDTTGLASFQEWKLMNERADLAKFQAEQMEQPVAAPVYKAKAPVRKAKKPVPAQTSNNTGNSDNSGSTQNNDNGAVVNTGNTDNGNAGTGETQEPAKEEKKGISNAAKGTVIGAAGGAVIGAVIMKKNRVLGGVLGGVIGGGVGYGIGRKMDKKEGR